MAQSCTLRLFQTRQPGYMYAAGVGEQLIMETTGHRSECVRLYKRMSNELLQAAQETVSVLPEAKKVKSDQAPSTSSQGFGEEIVKVQESNWFDENVMDSEGETVTCKVNTGAKRLCTHKNPCLSQKTSGDCTNLCSVLKKVNQKTEAQKKKKRLSLQFKNGCYFSSFKCMLVQFVIMFIFYVHFVHWKF